MWNGLSDVHKIEIHDFGPLLIPLSYTPYKLRLLMVEGTGFEPVKAEPTDLQSVPFGQLGNPSIFFGAGERN